jgi:hypothetical protein
VFRTAGYAVRRQSVDRNTTNVIAGDQRGVVHEALNVLKEKAMSDGPLNEAKALDMVGLKSKVVGPATSSSRGLQQSTLPVESHIINTHADGPSQFGKGKRPRSHLPTPPTTPPAPGTHQAHIAPRLGPMLR